MSELRKVRIAFLRRQIILSGYVLMMLPVINRSLPLVDLYHLQRVIFSHLGRRPEQKI